MWIFFSSFLHYPTVILITSVSYRCLLLQLPSTCKSLFLHLIVHTFCDDETPNINPSKAFIQRILSQFPTEFCVRLLILEEEKSFEKVLNRLDQKGIGHIIDCTKELIEKDQQSVHLFFNLDYFIIFQDNILRRFGLLLAKSQDTTHLSMACRMTEAADQCSWRELLLNGVSLLKNSFFVIISFSRPTPQLPHYSLPDRSPSFPPTVSALPNSTVSSLPILPSSIINYAVKFVLDFLFWTKKKLWTFWGWMWYFGQ